MFYSQKKPGDDNRKTINTIMTRKRFYTKITNTKCKHCCCTLARSTGPVEFWKR